MKDYYAILGVTPDSDEDHIRRQYRKLAMQYHPDRNPDDLQAEENFKSVAEAYGVLTDPVKRSQYDRARAGGGDWRENVGQGGFSYSQEDILKDLFQDPRFQAMFQGLLQEFQRNGFRYSSRFVRNSFFGGKGLFIGGLFMFGSLAGPALLRSISKNPSEKKSLLKGVGDKLGSLLGGSGSHSSSDNAVEPAPQEPRPAGIDTTYEMRLSARELAEGKTVQVVSHGPDGQEMLKVKIPPGSRSGSRLRLRGKGKSGPAGRGDLYLKLEQLQE
jgi:curved DNA-binding protein